jgi:hypothetical protein
MVNRMGILNDDEQVRILNDDKQDGITKWWLTGWEY